MRSPGNVLAEIEMLAENYGVRSINLLDDNFNLSKQRVVEICEGIIERGLSLTLEATSGLYLAPWLDLETLSLMKRAGFSQISFGIESGNKRILDTVINKKIDLDRVPEVAQLCKKAGIVPGGFFMIGIPGETLETMEDTIQFALNSGLDQIRVFTCQAFPGSKMYEDCMRNGWLVGNLEPSGQMPYGSCSYLETVDFSPKDVYAIAEKGKKMLRKAKKLDMPIE
jgi:radical SAM superfamily enzyme YgiQ (UPF0313 family)